MYLSMIYPQRRFTRSCVIHYTDNVPFILSTWIIVTGRKFLKYPYSWVYQLHHILSLSFHPSGSIHHDDYRPFHRRRGNRALYQYYHNLLSCKLYRWHSLCYQRDHKGNGMPSSSSLKMSLTMRFLYVCPYIPLSIDKCSIKMPC